MAEPAFQIELPDPASYVVRGVNLPQLADFGEWLANRAAAVFPGYQHSHIFGWLRSISGTNGQSNFHFISTNNAVGLFEYRNEALQAKPRIIDHFVFVKEGADVAEGQALYRDAKRWANAIGASEIQINPKSDVPLKLVEEVLGKTTERKVTVYKVGK